MVVIIIYKFNPLTHTLKMPCISLMKYLFFHCMAIASLPMHMVWAQTHKPLVTTWVYVRHIAVHTVCSVDPNKAM